MNRRISLILTVLTVFSLGIANAETAKPVKVQVIFVLDTTGSMGGLIAAAKDKIWAIASTLATAKPAPEISMGLVAYRDKNDDYITRLSPLTADIDRVYGDLMDFQAAGGGDGPESVNQALSEAVHAFAWDSDPAVYKVIFLVGDWPPHMDYRDDVKYPESARAAKKKGIIINTIQMGDVAETTPVWREIARISGGDFFRIGSENVSTHYETPYDKEIASLSLKHGETRVYYGDRETLSAVKTKEETEKKIYGAASDSVIAQRNMYNLSESGKMNFTGSADLIDKVASGEIRVEDVKAEELPEEFRKMSMKERKRAIDEKIKLRKEYEKQLVVLNEKRQSYIRELARKNAAREKGSFDNKVFESLKTQGADRNLNLEGGLTY